MRPASGTATRWHELGDLPAERRRLGRRQREPAGADFGLDPGDQLAPNPLGLRGRASGRRGTRAARARCSALSSRIWRTVRPTQLTKLAAELTLMRAHPGEQVAMRVEAFAVREDRASPGPRVVPDRRAPLRVRRSRR